MEFCRKIITTKPIVDNLVKIDEKTEGIRYAEPSPCVFNRFEFPDVELIDEYGYTVERGVYNVRIKTADGKVLILPNEIYESVEKIIQHNGNLNVLLYGAPGTGKTSVAEFVAKVKGWRLVKVSPETVLSRYVGESEKKLEETFRNALKNRPSIVFIDDGEWLASSRNLASGDDSTSVHNNLVNITLDFLNNLMVNNYPVIVILATNQKQDTLDQAILSRMHMKVAYPLPDVEAVTMYLQGRNITTVNVNGKQMPAEEFVRWAVNNGLSFRDIFGILQSGRLKMKTEKEGHRLVAHRPVDKNAIQQIANAFKKIFACPSNSVLRLVLFTKMPMLWKALIVSVITEYCGSVVFVPSIYASPQEFLFAIENYRNPVIFLDMTVYNHRYADILSEANVMTDVNILMVAPLSTNVDPIRYFNAKQVSDQDLVNELSKFVYSTNQTHVIASRLAMIVSVVLDFYGIKYDKEMLRFRGDRTQGTSFEDIVGISRSALMPDSDAFATWLLEFDRFLRSPAFELKTT